MRENLKKMLSVLICIIMLLPAAVFADDSDTVLESISLTGMTTPVKFQEVKKPDIREKSGNKTITISSGNWYRSADEAIVYYGNKFDSGTEYYYTFYVNIGPKYVISPECVFYLDGEKIPAENISYSNHRAYIKTKNYITEGTKKKFLDKITLYNVAQPAFDDSPSEFLKKITVPEDAPYKIHRAWWGYKLPDGYSAFAGADFSDGDKYSLTLELKLDDGYGTSYTNTKIDLPDSIGTPNETFVRGVLSDPEKYNPSITISYTVKQPESKTVTLDANGGTFPAQSVNTMKLLTDKNGQVASLPDQANLIYKKGCYLIGWFTKKDGGEQVDTSKKYNQDTTLYAHWGEIIDEVRLYTVMPLPGRRPVLFKLNGNGDYSVSQYWYNTDSEMLAFSDDDIVNAEAEKQGILLTQYEKSKFYQYYAEITSSGDKQFTNETKIYLNGEKLENNLTYPSKRLTVSESYVAAERKFEVFDGGAVEIPAGICGDTVKTIDLNNYISCSSGSYTVTADNDFSAYGLTIEGNRYITGNYPNTETEEKTFTLTVTSGSTSKELSVHIGRTQKTAFIERQTKEINVSCEIAGGAAIVNVCAPSDVTAKYEWQIKTSDIWLSLTDSPNCIGTNTAALVIQDSTQSALVRCIITVGTEKLTTTPVKYNVNHNYKTYSQKDGDTHNHVCACGSSKAEKHVYKYDLERDADNTTQGLYTQTCVRCKYSISQQFSKSTLHPNFQLYITNDSSPDRVARCAAFSKSRPLSYNPSKNGYTFLGWTVDKESQTPDYSSDEAIFITNKDLSLYAVWGQNITAVSGKNINTQGTSDVFGDGSVIYTPQTATKTAVLTLENAHITSYPVTGVSSETGIYTNTDIEIRLVGDNVIETETASAIGILSGGKVSFTGDGSLKIRAVGSGYYATGVKAKGIDVYSKNIYITDCKTAFDGKAALHDGVTEIYSRNYEGNDFEPFTHTFEQDEDAPMSIMCAEGEEYDANKAEDIGEAMNAKYLLITPNDMSMLHYNADRKKIIPVGLQDGIIVLSRHDEKGCLLAAETTEVYANKESQLNLSLPFKAIMLNSFNELKPLCEPVEFE